VETNQRVVALTFDDGPSGQFTQEILEVLAEHDVTATFFVVGEELIRNPEAGHQIATHGHELGNHSYRHKRMVLKPISFIESEITETDRLIREAG
jgi:chitin deacetylase